IAVDHYGLETGISKRERGMAAAVIEFDSLSDAVWSRAKDHYLSSVGRRGFAFLFVSRIKIGSERFEFGTARIDAFVNLRDAKIFAVLANLVFRCAGQIKQASVGQSIFFRIPKDVLRYICQVSALDPFLDQHDLIELIQ